MDEAMRDRATAATVTLTVDTRMNEVLSQLMAHGITREAALPLLADAYVLGWWAGAVMTEGVNLRWASGLPLDSSRFAPPRWSSSPE